MANGLFSFTSPEDILAARRASLSAPSGPAGTQAGFQIGAALGGTLPGLFGFDPQMQQAVTTERLAKEATTGLDLNNPADIRAAAEALSAQGEVDAANQLMQKAQSVENQGLQTQAARQQIAKGAQSLQLGDLRVKEAQDLAPFVSKRAHAQLRQADLNLQKTELELQSLRQQINNPATSDLERAKLLTEQASLLDKQRQQNFDREDKHRAEYAKAIAPVQETIDNAESLIGLLSGDTAELPAAQIAAVFKFLKGLDPASTVREGEYAAVAQATGLLDRFFSADGRLLEGQQLTPKLRGDLVKVMTNLRDAASRKAGDVDNGFVQLVNKRGLDINSVRPARVQQELARAQATPAGQGGQLPPPTEAELASAAKLGISFDN